MGGLINTVGTRILIEHFNMEFRGSRLRDIRNDHPINDPKGQPIQEYFRTDQNLDWLTDNIKHAHAKSSTDLTAQRLVDNEPPPADAISGTDGTDGTVAWHGTDDSEPVKQ